MRLRVYCVFSSAPVSRKCKDREGHIIAKLKHKTTKTHSDNLKLKLKFRKHAVM